MLPCVSLLPGSIKTRTDFISCSSVDVVREHAESLIDLFGVGFSASLLDTGKINHILTDESLSEGIRSTLIIEEANRVLDALSQSFQNKYPHSEFEPVVLALEYNLSSKSALNVQAEGVSRVEMDFQSLPSFLLPVVLPLLDRLCSFGHVIPEWSTVDYCRYSCELADDLAVWIGLLPNLKPDDDTEIEDMIEQHDLYGLFSARELEINLWDKEQCKIFLAEIKELDGLKSLIPDDKQVLSDFCKEIRQRISDLILSGQAFVSAPLVQWCFSVINALEQVTLPFDRFCSVFCWECDEETAPLDFSNVLDIGAGLLPLLEGEYQHQMEAGETIIGVVQNSSPEEVLAAFNLHCQSLFLLEKGISLINAMRPNQKTKNLLES